MDLLVQAQYINGLCFVLLTGTAITAVNGK